MAKKTTRRTRTGQPSKSAAIVEFVQQNPGMKNTEIAAALSAQTGWDVTPGYVSTIKSQKGLSKKRKTGKKKAVATKTVKRAGRPKTATTSDLSLSQLQDAKQFADRIGGVEQARKTLDALAELQG